MIEKYKTFPFLPVSLHVGLLLISLALPTKAQSSRDLHVEFEPLNWEDVMVRLDNSLIELGNSPKSNWYVIVYGGQNRRRGEAEAWLACIEDHIFNRRRFVFSRYGFSRDQIKVVHGGYRENVTVELWLIRGSGSVPSIKPTLGPQDVKYKGRMNKKWRSLCKS